MKSQRSLSFLLAAALLLACTGCIGSTLSDNRIPIGAGNTLVLADGASGSSSGGAGYNIPPGTIVSSDSVIGDAISMGATDLSSEQISGFDGEVFGGANFNPADASFSNPVDFEIPVDGVIGDAYVYYVTYDATSALGAAHFLKLGLANISGGRAGFSNPHFGTYIVGRLASEHNEGSGGSI